MADRTLLECMDYRHENKEMLDEYIASHKRLYDEKDRSAQANLHATIYTYYHPNMTVAEFRARIDATLSAGTPWGKIFSTRDKDAAMLEWQQKLSTLPLNASTPDKVYELAPLTALNFIGY